MVAAAAAAAAAPMEGVEGHEQDDVDDLFAAIESGVAREEANMDHDVGHLHSVEQACAEELKRCLQAPSLVLRRKEKGETIHSDPLEWWKVNQALFPILARLAKICLAVQATSAPSERVFSVASRLISNKRASLDPQMAGKTLFVAENWQWWKDQLDCTEAIAEDW